jgi:O-6-methylguanine DNA methyltransferase
MNNTRYKCTVYGLNQSWTLIATRKGVCHMLYPHMTSNDPLIEDRDLFTQLGIMDLLEQYFTGEPVNFNTVPLDLTGTSFQQSVWTALRQVPHGETWTYKQLAVAMGKPTATRAIGTAIGRNPLPIILPCHRIIGADGTLTGYRGGLQLKQRLLALEGVTHGEAVGHARFQF